MFGEVHAPRAVRVELAKLHERDIRFAKLAPEQLASFVAVRDSDRVAVLSLHLDPAEAEAVALALELKADLLLLDERRGARTARQLGLKTLGALGVLLHARQRGLVPAVRPLVDRLINDAGFWIGLELRQRMLAAAGE